MFKSWRFFSAALVVLLLVSGCATFNPSQQGLNFMNSGNYQAAYNVFVQCANAGNPYCINNIGVMYQRGYMQGGQNLNLAAQYYTLAARYGVPIAKQNLRALGKPVPASDLQAGYQNQQYQEQQAAAELSRSIGCALGGGCPQNTQQSSYQPAPAPSYQPAPVNSYQPKQVAPAGCQSDFDCGYGNRCVKPSGTFGRGQCVTPVNEHGIRTYDVPTPSVGPREVSSCRFTTDCPIGFTCDKSAGGLNGLCVK